MKQSSKTWAGTRLTFVGATSWFLLAADAVGAADQEHVSGKVIGVISGHGDVTTSSGKNVGKIRKDGTMKSMKGHVVTTDPDGVVKVAGKEVAKVEAGYKDDKGHGCALHCFFSAENEDSKETDKDIKNK